MLKQFLFAIACLIGINQASQAAVNDDKTRPVLLVHGLNPVMLGGVNNCYSQFAPIINALRANGFTGDIKTLTYYRDSTNCDVNLANMYNIPADATWKELGQSLSKYVFSNYTRFGYHVDMVGHSMGGLVIRAAIKKRGGQ